MKYILIVCYLIACIKADRFECSKRQFLSNSFVCACNSTYCDTVESVDTQDKDVFFQQFVTSRDKYRLDKLKLKFSTNSLGAKITINRNKSFQLIKGFGGAITDSAGFNIYNISELATQKLIESYFAPDGIQYNILRVPLAGVDFSLREYSYDDYENDFDLEHFALSYEDLKWKIPFIKSAMSLSQKDISFFASAWTAPPWMKTNKDYKGNGTLIGPVGGVYFQTWANYYLKFFQEYQKHNITFWGVTAQNEPTDGYLFKFTFNCMGFTPESQAAFVVENLGPTLKKNGFADIKIMILDDQRLFLETWPEKVFAYSPDAHNYIDGIAVHWYLDSVVPPSILDTTHNLFPDKFIFSTEACTGAGPLKPNVILGDFFRAESYAKDIIQDLNHWVTGWTDWNLALDLKGGPNWANNFVDSPIIVNSVKDEFYKQPMFYALGHFSKFINENSVRIDLVSDTKLIKHAAAFHDTSEEKTTLVIVNDSDADSTISIYDPDLDKYLNVNCHAHSIQTIVWFL